MLETDLIAYLEQGRQRSDPEISRLLDDAQSSLPLWYEAVYGPWSDAIAELDRRMAELFLDLAFDILSVYVAWRGPFPREDEAASADFLHHLDLDLKAVSGATTMHPAFVESLERRFEERAATRQYPVPLLSYLKNEVDRFPTFGQGRTQAVPLTRNLLSLLVAWLHEIYHLAGK